MALSNQTAPMPRTKKRAAVNDSNVDLTLLPNKRAKAVPKVPGDEKRLRRFREKAPKSYLQKQERAVGQRMFVIDRTRAGTADSPEEIVEMAGSTGNIYNVTIACQPSCTCPDNEKGNQCKHIVYVLQNVLKAPDYLQYQLAFLSSELRLIFANAPPLPSVQATGASSEHPSHRKDTVGDCPICFIAFEPGEEEIVWCKAACGNNIHKGCFEQWAASERGKLVKCVYCRTPWQGDEESLAKIKERGKINAEGYVNVGELLGLSASRDTSTYHQFWVRRQNVDSL